MARPKSFDVDEVLEQAGNLFWTQGYEATSIRDLEQALGVGRQSLYDTFGDKHALFLQALQRYSGDTEELRAGLRCENAGLAEIHEWFDATVTRSTAPGPRPACLIVNTVAELGTEDGEAARICRKNRESLARQFRHALSNAVARGEIPPLPDVGATADYLIAQTFGIILLGKNGANRKRLRAVAEQSLRAIT